MQWETKREGGGGLFKTRSPISPVVRSVRVRFRTLTFHGYARLRALTPQPSAHLWTLGLGDTEGDLLCSHAWVLCKIGAGGIFVSELCVPMKHFRGFPVKKKMCAFAHAWTGRWRTPTHTYNQTLRTLKPGLCARS